MAFWPTTPKAIKARISSYRRILRQEFTGHSYGGDGYGKRYWLFYLYFLLREDDEARAYIDWYRTTFPDDIGDAGQFVCWALILHRLGHEDEAIYRFVEAIDEKLPVVADLVDDLQAPYGIWGEELWEMYRVDADIRRAMTDEERAWLRAAWTSPAVAAMRERHIANGRAFAAATTREQREALSREGLALVEAFKPKEMPPLSVGDPQMWLTAGRRPRKNGKVIRTSPEVWTRGGALPPVVAVPHEIVVRFADRRPIRFRGLIDRATATEAARRMVGKIIVGDDISVSTRGAISYAVVPDGQGPVGAEEVTLPRA